VRPLSGITETFKSYGSKQSNIIMTSWFFGSSAAVPSEAEEERAAVRLTVDKLVAAHKVLLEADAALTAAIVKDTARAIVKSAQPPKAPPAAAPAPSNAPAAAAPAPTNASDAAPAPTNAAPAAPAPAAAAAASVAPEELRARLGAMFAAASKDAKGETSFKVGDAVNAIWPDNKSWYTARVIGFNPANGTYGILFDDGGLIPKAAPEAVRAPVPFTSAGNVPRFTAPATIAAWNKFAEAAYALHLLRPMAEMLVKYAGPQLAAGQHMWVAELMDGVPVLKRHRIVQVATSEITSSFQLAADPLPVKGAPVAPEPAHASPVVVRPVSWTIPAQTAKLAYIPSIADVVDSSVDDNATVRALNAVFGAMILQHQNPAILL
jgi:hypothetical protein